MSRGIWSRWPGSNRHIVLTQALLQALTRLETRFPAFARCIRNHTLIRLTRWVLPLTRSILRAAFPFRLHLDDRNRDRLTELHGRMDYESIPSIVTCLPLARRATDGHAPNSLIWSLVGDSNPRPPHYKCGALSN